MISNVYLVRSIEISMETFFQEDMEGFGVDPTASFHDDMDAAMPDAVAVPPTQCPLAANAFAIFKGPESATPLLLFTV